MPTGVGTPASAFRVKVLGGRPEPVRLLFFATLLLSSPGWAQGITSDQRLLLWEGTLRGSPRMMGLSGAFVGIGEGAEGITRNPASAAAKDPHFEHDFNVELGGTMHFLFPGGTKTQDWDNDGMPEQAEGPIFNLGTQVFYSAISIQYKFIALGLGFDLQNFLSKIRLDGEGFDRFYTLGLVHIFGALAFSVWKDQILFGFGIESTHALVGYAELPDNDRIPGLKDSMGYHGWGFQFGGLWRPEDQDYRVGFAFKPQTFGRPLGGQRELFHDLIPFSEIASPARLSLGGSFTLGNGRHYNITSPSGWMETDVKDPTTGKNELSPAMTKFLFTVQLDVFFPVQNATSVSAFLQQPTVPALVAGNRVSFELRAAVQKEVLMDRLRLWVGGYLEPPMTATGYLRPHVTFGGELYLFKLGRTRLSFGLSFDFARMYENLSFAVLTWK
jgi:hypothetical protein